MRREVDYLPGIRIIPKKLIIKGRSLGPLRGFSPYERADGILVPKERKTYSSNNLKFDLISPPRVDGRDMDETSNIKKDKKSKKKRKKKKNKLLSSPYEIESSRGDERDQSNLNLSHNKNDIQIIQGENNFLNLPQIERNYPISITRIATS